MYATLQSQKQYTNQCKHHLSSTNKWVVSARTVRIVKYFCVYCVVAQSLPLSHFGKESQQEAYISLLLRRRCSQNLSRRHNHYQRICHATLSPETVLYLEDSVHVVIANPKWVSAVKGNKDGKKDSHYPNGPGQVYVQYERHRCRGAVGCLTCNQYTPTPKGSQHGFPGLSQTMFLRRKTQDVRNPFGSCTTV